MEEYTVYAIYDSISLKKIGETEDYFEAEEFYHKGYIIDEHYNRKIPITSAMFAHISVVTSGKSNWEWTKSPPLREK